jgi:transcriptional regulator with XRE-family HTH domain
LTHPFGELSVPRRQLGSALRELRTHAGLSGPQIAERIGISQSQASRIELGQQGVPVATVQQWAEAAGATVEDLARVLELAESATTQAITWRRAMQRGLATLQEDSREFESTAGTILNFQSMRVPGLLQVPEYARRIFVAGNPPGHPDIAASVAGRMNRQTILYDEKVHLEFVMAEVALRWPIAPPAVMRAQLDRISVVGSLENVRIGIIPLDVEISAWHDHGFNILDDREDGPVVHVETLTSGLTITDPADVGRYREAFDSLQRSAAFGSEATQILEAAASRYRTASLCLCAKCPA